MLLAAPRVFGDDNFSDASCVPKVKAIPDDVIKACTARVGNVRVNSLLGFFTARQVERYAGKFSIISIEGCIPPPDSQRYQGKTILPNPVRPNFPVYPVATYSSAQPLGSAGML